MSNGVRNLTLTAHMAGWGHDRVVGLLQRRPDLVAPKPPADLAELAARAQRYPSVSLAIDRANLAENRMLQLVVCCRPDVGLDALAAALPDGTSLGDVESVLRSLEDAALVWRHDGRLCSSGVLRQAMPTTLGPPIAGLANGQTVEYLKAVTAKIRAAVDGSRIADRLPAVPGPKGRPARKAQLVDHLEDLLATPGVVDVVLRKAPAEARSLATSMANGRSAIPADRSLHHYSPYGRNSYYSSQPSFWLFEHGLLLPATDRVAAFQPREVGVALRGGRPVADLALDPPALATGSIDQSVVDQAAAERGVATLDAVAEILGRWADVPAKQLKTGGLGVAVVKQTAAALDTTVEDAGRIVELAHLAGLLEDVVETRLVRRKPIREGWVRPSAVASDWLQQPAERRWAQLAGAWLRAEHWPSVSGRQLSDSGKPVPVFSRQRAENAPARRREVLDGLAALGLDRAGVTVPTTSPEALAAWVYWQQPQAWLREVAGQRDSAIAWTYEEAELLGIAAAGSLSAFGGALLAGQADEAQQLFAARAPAEVTSFTLQADMTAVVVGRLARDALTELRLLADVESTGAATTFRFSEATLRRAIDAGRDGDSILSFLRKHAGKGVPQALEYLVTDVARRHGHLLVGTARSFVTSEDPAVLADACAYRRTRKLRLQLLAPTVAVSPEPADKVLAILRDAGFLPANDESSSDDVAATGRGRAGIATNRDRENDTGSAPDNVVVLSRSAVSDDATAVGAAVALPEPFRQRHRPDVASAPSLGAQVAARHAAAICHGPAADPSSAGVDNRFDTTVEGDRTARAEPARLELGLDPEAAERMEAVNRLGEQLAAELAAGDLNDGDMGFDAFEAEFEEHEEGLTLESFQAIVHEAAATGGVLGLLPEDAAEDDPPILLGVTALHGDDGVAGLDLLTGEPTVVYFAELAAVLELGSVGLPVPRSPRSSSGSGQRRGARSRGRGRGRR